MTASPVDRRTLLTAMVGGTFVGSGASQAESTPGVTAAPPGTSPLLARALGKYEQDVSAARGAIRSVPYYNRSPMVRAQGEHLLQQLVSAAFHGAVAPRPDLPHIMRDTFLAPLTFTHSGPNPDVRYGLVFLNGRKTYRLWGRRNDSPFCYLQLSTEYQVPEGKTVGEWMLDDFHLEKDGRFEIILSARQHPGNWIKLDENNDRNALLLRIAALDWLNTTPTQVHIEPLDAGVPSAASYALDEGELARRIERAGRSVRFMTEAWAIELSRLYWQRAGEKLNAFGTQSGAPGAAPIGLFGTAFFELNADEALILESDVPESILWHFIVRDPWLQLPDWIHYQNTLNAQQARLDRDGKFRAVISLRDPGVPNWLDPVGITFGQVNYRWYKAARAPSPTMKRVAFADIRKHLPPDTPVFTPQQRIEQLRRRREGGMKFFGYV